MTSPFFLKKNISTNTVGLTYQDKLLEGTTKISYISFAYANSQ